jgi:Protein of unknown function (DUF4240)
LIEDARARVAEPGDVDAVADRATALLSALPREEIVAAERVLSGLLADSYQILLWAAAYLINGGCSDDGFEYFRCWLIAQGRHVFERSLADPDALADAEAIRAAPPGSARLDGESMLYIAMRAYRAVTGEEIPREAFTAYRRELENDWDFDDWAEMNQRLPRLTARGWPPPP